MSGEPHGGTVRDWMTRDPLTVSEQCPVHTAVAQMRAADIRHLLVVDGDRLVGIVSSRDVRRLLEEDPGRPELGEPIARIMSEGPTTVAPETALTAAARLLLEARVGALPVRDGDHIVGIFTTADALEALLALVEPSVP